MATISRSAQILKQCRSPPRTSTTAGATRWMTRRGASQVAAKEGSVLTVRVWPDVFASSAEGRDP